MPLRFCGVANEHGQAEGQPPFHVELFLDGIVDLDVKKHIDDFVRTIVVPELPGKPFIRTSQCA